MRDANAVWSLAGSGAEPEMNGRIDAQASGVSRLLLRSRV